MDMDYKLVAGISTGVAIATVGGALVWGHHNKKITKNVVEDLTNHMTNEIIELNKKLDDMQEYVLALENEK